MFYFVLFVFVLAIDFAYSHPIQYVTVCPEGFDVIGKKCYHFSKDKTVWSLSHSQCENINGNLAAFDSEEESKLVQEFINKNATIGGADEWWTDGLYELGSWKWTFNQKEIQGAFFKEHKGPEDGLSCLAMKRNSWAVKDCTEDLPYICSTVQANVTMKIVRTEEETDAEIIIIKRGAKELECENLIGREKEKCSRELKPEEWKEDRVKESDSYMCRSNMVMLGNVCYYFSTDALPWLDAFYACEGKVANLAIISNKDEDDRLKKFLNRFGEKQDRWIGGIYEQRISTWTWAKTAEVMKYKGFAEGLMEGKEIYSEFAYMDPGLDNRWNFTHSPTVRKRYICQKGAERVKRKRTAHKRRG